MEVLPYLHILESRSVFLYQGFTPFLQTFFLRSQNPLNLPYDFGGIAPYDDILRDAFGYHRTRSDYGVIPYADTWEDCGIYAYPHAFADFHALA